MTDNREEHQAAGRLRPAAFLLPGKRRFRGRGFAHLMGRMSHSNRPQPSGENGDSETKPGAPEAKKRQNRDGFATF